MSNKGTNVTANRISYGFPTATGRGLFESIPEFVHTPFLVVTMEDLWDRFRHHFDGADHEVLFVTTTDQAALDRLAETYSHINAIVGIGGGQALDVAKYITWRRRLPLFQFPTALSVNAVYGQRSGVRADGNVIYRGWAVPQCVFIDLDVIADAPPQLNYSGIGDILCFHTGVLDWKYATDLGKCEDKWPYNPDLAAQSLEKVEAVITHAQDIRDLTPDGIRVLLDGLSWGTSYHGAGWCPRHIEGIDHFLFYTLENRTGKKFLHGQPVCLGIYVGSLLHNARAAEMLATMRTIGLDIRPEAMGITWDDVEGSLYAMKDYVHHAGLWHSIAHDIDISSNFFNSVRDSVEEAYRDFPPA